jgi:hypothetical protein
VQPPPVQAGYYSAPPAGYPTGGNFNGAMMNLPPPQVVSPQTQSRGNKTF